MAMGDGARRLHAVTTRNIQPSIGVSFRRNRSWYNFATTVICGQQKEHLLQSKFLKVRFGHVFLLFCFNLTTFP